jgi:hypothetical protein
LLLGHISFTEDYNNNQQVEEKVYYKDPDLSGGIECINYPIEYRVNCDNIKKEAYLLG